MNDKKKIILHYYTYPINSGGPLTYIDTIINSELSKEFDFHVCFQNSTLSRMTLKKFRDIVKTIKTIKPDIVHIHGLQGEGFLGLIAAKRAKSRFVLMTVHGIQQDSVSISKFKRKIFRWIIEPYTLKKSNAVYCVSSEMHNRTFIQQNTKRLLPFISNFIDYEKVASLDKTVCRKKLNIKENEFIVVIVGRITVDKGMITVEKCIKNCTIPNVRFIFLGEGSYQEKLKSNLLGLQEKFTFIGHTDFVINYLSAADVYLSASLHENFSMALLEACAVSLPCIVTNVGDNAKIIIDNKTGFLVDVNDYQTILIKLNFLYEHSDLRILMGAENRKNVVSNYSKKVFFDQIRKLYRTL